MTIHAAETELVIPAYLMLRLQKMAQAKQLGNISDLLKIMILVSLHEWESTQVLTPKEEQ